MFQYSSPGGPENTVYPFMDPFAFPYYYIHHQHITFDPPTHFPPSPHFIPDLIPQRPRQNTQNCIESLSKPARTLDKPLSSKIKSETQKELIRIEGEEIQYNKKRFKQKFGRNIYSNIFHLMVNFVKSDKSMKPVVAQIITQNQLNITVAQFYHNFKYNSYRLKSYANIAKIQEFWRGPAVSQNQNNMRLIKEAECAKIFRILCKKYLVYEHLPYVFNSQKIKLESKRLHTAAIRKILQL